MTSNQIGVFFCHRTSQHRVCAQDRALSAHRTKESYEGYAKRNLPRALSATRKRYAHVLANASETGLQNSAANGVQNENPADSKSA